MKYREILRIASVEISAHKTRSALTCVSLAVGVAAILYTFSQVSSVNRQLQAATELAGPGRISIQKERGYVSRGLSPGLTTDDSEAIRRAWPELYMVYPLATRWGVKMAFGGFHAKDMIVKGTTPDWRLRDWVYTLQGRFLNEADVRDAARVCVLMRPGGWINKPAWAISDSDRPQELEKLLAHQDMVGRQVELDDHMYTVVGVIREPPKDKDPRWFRDDYGGGGGGTLLVPVTTYQRYLISSNQKGGVKSVDNIQVDTGREDTVVFYKERIERLLRISHRGEKDVKVSDWREVLEGAAQEVRKFAAAILVIGVVAILAGGIGILNVTLATVFSRIREIGIRRALGATRRDVVLQFVTEAMLLGLFGGAAGLPVGWAAVRWLSSQKQHFIMPGFWQIAVTLVIAIGTGLLFSVYPAWLASRFDPIEALRYE